MSMLASRVARRSIMHGTGVGVGAEEESQQEEGEPAEQLHSGHDTILVAILIPGIHCL